MGHINWGGLMLQFWTQGIDGTHPDLEGKVAGGYDFTGTDSYSDDNGHGTHVSGTVAAIYSIISESTVLRLLRLFMLLRSSIQQEAVILIG